MTAPTTGRAPADPPPRATQVDESLIDLLLALSPEERLRLNDRMVLTIQELRHEETLRRRGGG